MWWKKKRGSAQLLIHVHWTEHTSCSFDWILSDLNLRDMSHDFF